MAALTPDTPVPVTICILDRNLQASCRIKFAPCDLTLMKIKQYAIQTFQECFAVNKMNNWSVGNHLSIMFASDKELKEYLKTPRKRHVLIFGELKRPARTSRPTNKKVSWNLENS